MAQSLYLLVLLYTLLLSIPSQSLYLSGFQQSGENLTLDGSSAVESSGILRLTNDSLRISGHAFLRRPLRLKNSSFSTAFAFSIVPQYPRLGGHGLAFAISPTPRLPGALPSQYLGLLNSTTAHDHVFAVEFDTVQDFEFSDVDDNHVGIDVDSLTSKASAPAAFFPSDHSTNRQSLNLKSGRVIQAWIDYHSVDKHISVFLSPFSSKPKTPILKYQLDLSTILGDDVYVGFSSSTGLLASSHYILGWSFEINGQAESLSLDSLPKFPNPGKNRTLFIAAVSVSGILILFLVTGVSFFIIRRRMKNAEVIEPWELDVGPHRFSYRDLRKATRNFRDRELIGFGGFGKVYKGTLPDTDTQVAVKRISHESKQGLQEFVSEIASIGRLRHRNLVQLLGWCRRGGDLILVYDFMVNGSLDKYLFNSSKWVLTWEQRVKIVKGVAAGLLYLHEEWEQAVIHRDVKAGNVLLDEDLNGRLGDFGLAKLYEHGSNPGTTRVVGTLGYLAPELTRTGKPTPSSDVFAFGALILEVVCGRRPIEPKAMPEELILVDWAWEKWAAGEVAGVVDPRLGGEFDEAEVSAVVKLGLMCSSSGAEGRPTMRQVVRYLEGEVELILGPPCAYGDNVNSGPASSYFDKVSAWSDDVEAASASSRSLSAK